MLKFFLAILVVTFCAIAEGQTFESPVGTAIRNLFIVPEEEDPLLNLVFNSIKDEKINGKKIKRKWMHEDGSLMLEASSGFWIFWGTINKKDGYIFAAVRNGKIQCVVQPMSKEYKEIFLEMSEQKKINFFRELFFEIFPTSDP
ncbi:MAG: hypothetical protein AAB530_01920 [Patescibacteria group bacterium]